MTTPKSDPPQTPVGVSATVVHGAADDRKTHVVGIGNLRVHIDNDGSYWYAQGLEIDYLALGDTLAQAKEHFEEGLAATVGEHLRIHGHIEHLLTPAPPEVWKAVMKDAHRYSQVSVHQTPAENRNFPFEGIHYFAQDTGSHDVAGQSDPA